MRFLSIDFETGGHEPNRHAPVQIGCALMQDGEPVETFESLIGPTLHWKTKKIEREYNVVALQVSGLSWKEITKAPVPSCVVKELGDWSTAHGLLHEPIVAFNATFDMGFYSTLLWLASDWHPTERGRKVIPSPPFLGAWNCALMAARKALDLDNYDLDSVAAHFGLSRSGERHGALEDAILAGKVYERLAVEL